MIGRASRNARMCVGGDIDRARVVHFTYEGRALTGLQGDTLASALLANGVSVFGRSFKYHRPRGLLAAGVEEPNALMAVGPRSARRVNLRATEVELVEGLEAAPVNCWPSARFDFGSINDLFWRFLPAGFYYKSFMWPSWSLYEPFIRRAAGLGVPSVAPDRHVHDSVYAHADLVIIGAGAAGLAAARMAAAAGVRMILVEQDVRVGGALRWRDGEIAGLAGRTWAEETEASLNAHAKVRTLTRTTALGYFDHNELVLSERIEGDCEGRTRLWRVRAKQVILATGAIERPIVFPGNDRPGVMLASAVHRYLGQYSVRVGRRMALFANNDAAFDLARAYEAAGGEVAAIIDPRPEAERPDHKRIEGEIVATEGGGWGDPSLRAIVVRGRDGASSRIEAEVLAMSGGWSASLELFRQSGGRGAYDNTAQTFAPVHSVQVETSAGACNGVWDLASALEDGHRAALTALTALGRTPPSLAAPMSASAGAAAQAPPHRVAAMGRAFVDFQNDVTASDIELAVREGFCSPEHVKRYTTLGMAPDQGKTSNVNALAILADLRDEALSEFSGSSHRFPYAPVALGALSGLERGGLSRPMRVMPCHDAHVSLRARMEEYGSWLRPAFYGSDERAATDAEIDAVRHRAGLFEASPLGKIEVKGPDAAVFLDRVYANTMSTLKPGRLRYGLMLNEFGVIIDDGVTARLSEDEFLVGTTGAGAERITAILEEWLQCEWRELDVVIAPMTQAWGVLTLSGPQARAVLGAAGVDFDLNPRIFGHMQLREGQVGGLNARVARVSFTGETSFEVSVAADETPRLWQMLREAGAPFGLEPVGVEAWMHLRTEKGFLHIGADTDGTTTALDVGWSHVLKRKADFIGRRSLMRAADQSEDRHQFVGLEAIDGQAPLPLGSHLRAPGATGPSEGHVTSSVFSRVLGAPVALAMVRGGRQRMGEIVHVTTKAGTRLARISQPGGYDRDGARLEV